MLQRWPFGWREVMGNTGVDPVTLHAWLSARSVARVLPAPVADHGGFRVDTGSDAEAARWVFHEPGPGLAELSRLILEPHRFLKLCGTADELRAALPTHWQLHAPAYFMRATGEFPAHSLAHGYRVEIDRAGMVVEARIVSAAGEVAARGYAAETQHAFVYDRIVTEPRHRRQGLGRALMRSLQDARRNPAVPQLLVATEEGRALYTALGWQTLSDYSTASIAS